MFAIAAAPFIVCGFVDFILPEMRWEERLIVAAISGFAMIFVAALLTGSLPTGNVSKAFIHLGLMGVIPAIACSWLSNMSREMKHEAATDRGSSTWTLDG